MNIKEFLLLPTILSVIIIALILIFRKKLFTKSKIFWTGILIFFIIYLLIVGGAFINDLYLSHEASLLRNIDGGVDYENLSLERKQTWDKYINDTGRNFSVITGAIFSGVITIFYYLIALLKKYLSKIKSTNIY